MTPFSTRPEPSDDAEQAWKHLIQHGQSLFQRGENRAASHSFERAKTLALSRFDAWRDVDDAVAAVVVSHLNLADTQAPDDPNRAATTLCAAHAGLLRIRDAESLPELLRNAAARHLRETYSALAQFRQRHGSLVGIEQVLQASTAACLDRMTGHPSACACQHGATAHTPARTLH